MAKATSSLIRVLHYTKTAIRVRAAPLWTCSSTEQSVALSGQRARVRIPPSSFNMKMHIYRCKVCKKEIEQESYKVVPVCCDELMYRVYTSPNIIYKWDKESK